MSSRLIALLAVIAAFGALSAMALMEAGYIGVFLGPLFYLVAREVKSRAAQTA